VAFADSLTQGLCWLMQVAASFVASCSLFFSPSWKASLEAPFTVIGTSKSRRNHSTLFANKDQIFLMVL
jgi:hypothetical protein